jgi:hypothetical protein
MGSIDEKKAEDKNLTLLSLQAVENPFIPHLMRAKNFSPAADTYKYLDVTCSG